MQDVSHRQVLSTGSVGTLYYFLHFSVSLKLSWEIKFGLKKKKLKKKEMATSNLRSISFSWSGKGNGNPLQYSCLEEPIDREVWWATVHGVHKKVRQDLVTKPSNLKQPWKEPWQGVTLSPIQAQLVQPSCGCL